MSRGTNICLYCRSVIESGRTFFCDDTCSERSRAAQRPKDNPRKRKGKREPAVKEELVDDNALF